MKIDHIHFYTRNAVATKNWFIRNVGFQGIGNWINHHTHTELIALNHIYFAISSPLNSASPVAQYLNEHPEGIADLAFRVKNLAAILKRSRQLGVKIIQDLQESQGATYQFAQINGWQDLQHTLIEATDEHDYEHDCYLPRPQSGINDRPTIKSNLTEIDHVVLNVAQGKLNSAVTFYQNLFNFQVQQSFQIQTKSSGLTSQALIDETGEVQFNINQPTSTNSQIQEFIDFNRGSGIQHLALRSQNLISDVAQLRQRDLKFLAVPQEYYNSLNPNLPLNATEKQAVTQQQILVDGNETTSQSLLMQIFTQPIFEQPTFFLELIERRDAAQGFGQGNFQALFEAVEKQSKHRPSPVNEKKTV